MKVFQTFSIMTSSVHNLSMSRRWTSGSRKSHGDNRVISADRPRFGLSYTLWSWASRACLWPWKYKNLQCAGHMYELANVDHRASRQVLQKNDSKRAERPHKWWLRNFMYCVLTSPCNVVCLISLCLWATSQRSCPSYLNTGMPFAFCTSPIIFRIFLSSYGKVEDVEVITSGGSTMDLFVKNQ